MAKPDMGTKRQCQSCGAKFFDMNRSPITCPKCGVVYQPTSPRAAARAAAVADEEEKDTESPDLVPLEDAEAPEDAVAADDVEVEDDDSTTDTFLEEEEEDGDDVTGLIDGDIETDEEP